MTLGNEIMNTKGKHKTLIGLVAVTVMMSSMSAHAALTSVTQDGGLMVSDSTLNVTWADVASPTDLTWSASAATGSAQAWVASLNTKDYGGYSNWRLPTGDGNYTTAPTTSCGLGCGASTSQTLNELGNLFINELGNTPGSQVTNTSPFATLSTSGIYWSSTERAADPGHAWVFYSAGGVQYAIPEASAFEALAVRSGQVTAVPVPAAAWLLGSGLMGLMCLARRRAETSGLRSLG
jgi:hypothetical protein